MPEWVWLIALFVCSSALYWIGYVVGVACTDKSPSDNAWINVRKYAIDAEKETFKYQADKDYEYKMAALDRGVIIDDMDQDNENNKQN